MAQFRGAAVAAGLWLALVPTPSGAQGLDILRSPAASARVKLGTVEVRDLNFNTPAAGRWSIGRIGFTGFIQEGGRVRAARIDIERVAITAGTQTTEIPSIVMTGADLPLPLYRAMTAGEPASDLADLLATATIARVAIDRIVQRDPSAQLELSYSGLVVTGLKGGSVASLRLAGSLVEMPAPPGASGKVQVKAGEVRYQQLDVAEVVRLFTGGGSGGAKRVLQRAEVDGIDVTTDQATIRIDRAEIVDVDARAPAQPLPAHMRGPPAAGIALDPEQERQAAAYARDMLLHARIGRYGIKGIRVSIPGQGTFSLGSITLAGFSSGGIDRLEVTGLDVGAPGAGARFERFTLGGINYGALVEAGLNAAAAGRTTDFSPAQIAQMMPRLAALHLSRLTVETPPVTLAELRFDLEEAGETTHVNYAVRGLKVDLRFLPPNEGSDKLIALGYGELAADMQARVSLRPKDRALVVETVGLSLDQIGRLEVAALLENVDIDKAFADPDAAEHVLGEARLGPIQIRLADLGLAERFYAEAARGARISPDAVRAGLAAEMRSQAISNFGPLLAGRSADAIAAFLQSPGAITARIAPAPGQPPLTVAEIQNLSPPDLMRRLTVTLETAPR